MMSATTPRHLRPFLTIAVVVIPTLCMAAAPTEKAAPAGQNWPQWRGPLGTGAAPDADPPTEWNETKNVKWKVKLPGSGASTPIIWEDRIFIQTAIPAAKKDNAADAGTDARAGAVLAAPDDRQRGRGRGFGLGRQQPTEVHQFVLMCLDRKTGNPLWQKVAREEVPHEGHHPDHGFSSSSPVTDGKLVYAYFGSRGLHCYDLEGNLKWQKDLGRMRTRAGFGEGASPALHGDAIVVNWDHEGEDFIAAFDANTGDERWRKPRNEDTTWTTPLVVEHGGKPQVVVAATNKVLGYDLKTGQVLWETSGMTGNVIPTPVTADGVVYVTSGFRGAALLAIRLGHNGNLSGGDAIAWSHNKSTPYVSSPLLYDGRLYFFAGNRGVLSSFDAKTGKPVIDTARVDDLEGVYASPVGAGGRVYLVGRDGTTVVIEHADQLEELAVNKLDDPIDASPAVVGKELFLRGHRHLYCISAEK